MLGSAQDQAGRSKPGGVFGHNEEDEMGGDLLSTIPPRPYERWFDICFRLIILALAGFWVLMPPAGAPDRPVDLKAAETTR
ncbi:hypothetical protein [Bosea sp. (in: a-proteobacteria)]|jgi:hypothetical protein|uniref:hypothetical protein n=1 Tax=Bosea sp. (in: a-proteobacteria) TaxID=1871050 RepID=UPI003F70AE33